MAYIYIMTHISLVTHICLVCVCVSVLYYVQLQIFHLLDPGGRVVCSGRQEDQV